MSKEEFLHTHPRMEKTAGLPEELVIVDREDCGKARKYMTTPTIIVDDNVRTEPKKRYFIVFANGGINARSCFHLTTNGGYVTLVDIDKAYKEQFEGTEIIILIPTNIIELNESDYKDWVK